MDELTAFAKRGLGRGEPGDRHSEWAARHVIQPNLVAEQDRVGIATMFATNAALQVFLRRAAFGDTHFNQLTHARHVERLEGIAGKNFLLQIIGQERIDIVATVPERHLCQIVRTEAEEVGDLADFDRP